MTGVAAVTLSMRSSTPPCPGNSRPLSLRCTCRLSRLSVRSPTTEKPAAARHIGRNVGGACLNQAAPQAATASARTIPPTTPSQVLFGDTRGARRTRPNCLPAKKAPVSAAKLSVKMNSVHCAPLRHSASMCTSANQVGSSARAPAAAAARRPPRCGSRDDPEQSHASTRGWPLPSCPARRCGREGPVQARRAAQLAAAARTALARARRRPETPTTPRLRSAASGRAGAVVTAGGEYRMAATASTCQGQGSHDARAQHEFAPPQFGPGAASGSCASVRPKRRWRVAKCCSAVSKQSASKSGHRHSVKYSSV